MALDAKQRRALEQLAAGAKQDEAAREAGVSRETVSRWVNRDPEFASELDSLNREISGGVARRILAMHDGALDRLLTLMASEDEAIAMRAVAFVLEHGPLAKKGAEPTNTTQSEDRPATPEEMREAEEIAERLRAKNGKRQPPDPAS